ncbi:DUF262 domain-containing protein [Nocardiopsis dassonvillei]|uniref:DUF262 domain-containing protein n=1 Tax=Nocardiopsis dassonvillei TaxID=2014 RepID=UPI00366D54FD
MSSTPEQIAIPISEESGEGEDDVLGRLSAAHATVSATDWTVETIVTQMRKGRIDLNPKFQRRSAWVSPTKSRFIESVILSYPIPQIVLAEKKNKPGHYFVIDGKQRLLALRQFYAGQGNPSDEEFTSYKLGALSVIPDLKGFDIQKLESERPDVFDAFENHTIRTVTIKNWESENFLFTLFLRLNTGSVPLSPQELRQALVPGGFTDYAEEKSSKSRHLQVILGNPGPDRRMMDAELFTRYVAFQTEDVEYRGNLKEFLDKVCEYYNDKWEEKKAEIEKKFNEMELAIAAACAIFGEEAACHKWSGNRWERSFNRAVFDIQIYTLSSPDVREKALQKPEEVKTVFKNICVNDPDFIKAVTTTTKSLQATKTRFTTWAKSLETVLGLNVPTPSNVR